MSTVVNFHGKKCIEPGSYAATVYNPTSVVNVAEFGNVMIIDTGLSKATVDSKPTEFAGGAGIKGQYAKGMKSVYEFDNFEDFHSFMGGGIITDIAKKIFTPVDGAAGAPKLYYVRAAATKAAKIELVFESANKLILNCKNEGLAGNGVEVNAVLKVGYAAKIVAGEGLGNFKIQVFQGSFEGEDSDGEAYGAYKLSESEPILIAESPDIKNLQQAYDWAKSDKTMLANFVCSMEGSGKTVAKAVSQVLASGGTTEFSETHYSEVLEAIPEMDISFFLCTNLNAADGAAINNENLKLFTHIKQNAKFESVMFVAGGEEDTDLFGEENTSEAVAHHYNSENVVVVHGAPVVKRKDKNGIKKLPAIYLAASIVGLNAGMSAQTPLTFKRVGFQSFSYDLKKREREKALQAGIMHVRNVNGYWCVNQGISTLQNNKQTIADDGQSFELSITLIKAQLNKELIMEGQTRFTGKTAAQASPTSVKNFTETKLESLVASPGADNLLISWKNVQVSARNSDYYITYDFVPNVPVNKTFFIGNILDFTF